MGESVHLRERSRTRGAEPAIISLQVPKGAAFYQEFLITTTASTRGGEEPQLVRRDLVMAVDT